MLSRSPDNNGFIFNRLMCNYFSIGIESRIGLGFEKKRTRKACCNKMQYFNEGLKKMFGCCTKTLKVKQVVEYVSAVDSQGNDRVLFASSKNMQTDRYLSIEDYFMIFRWKPSYSLCK